MRSFDLVGFCFLIRIFSSSTGLVFFSRRGLGLRLRRPVASLENEERLVLAGKTGQRYLCDLCPLGLLPLHVFVHAHASEPRVAVVVLRADDGQRVALVGPDELAREAALLAAGDAAADDGVDEQEHGAAAAVVAGPAHELHAVGDGRVLDPGHAPAALGVVDGPHGLAVLAQHEGPVAVAAAHVPDVAAGGDGLERAERLVARADAAKVVHEDGQDVVAALDGLALGARAGELEVPAGPREEVEVRVRRRRLGPGDLQLRKRRVEEAPVEQVGGDRGAHRALLGVGRQRLEDVGRGRLGVEDLEVRLDVGEGRRREEVGRLERLLGLAGNNGRRVAVPGVQAVGGAEADDVLHLGQRHRDDGVVRVGVARRQRKGLGDGRGQVVLGQVRVGAGPEVLVLDVRRGIPLGRPLAVHEGLRGYPGWRHVCKVYRIGNRQFHSKWRGNFCIREKSSR